MKVISIAKFNLIKQSFDYNPVKNKLLWLVLAVPARIFATKRRLLIARLALLAIHAKIILIG